MHDLRINLYFTSQISGPVAPDGPGWYLYVTRSVMKNGIDHSIVNHEVVPHVRIPAREMDKLSQVLDNFAKNKERYPDTHLVQDDISIRAAVAEASREGQEIIEAEIARIKTEQDRLAELRLRAQEFDDELED